MRLMNESQDKEGSEEMSRTTLPLDGVTVLDAAHMMAGGLVGRICADLGARVIKVEGPDGEVLRGEDHPGWLPNPTFLALHRDQETVMLDLKEPSGLDAFLAIVDGADVVVQNYRAGVAERLGIGYEDLRTRKPSLVYCSVSGFGSTGPLAQLATIDGVIQAFSGILEKTGTSEGSFGAPSGIVLADLYTGTIAALAVVAALLERTRTGVGSYIDISMAEAGLYARMISCEGGMPAPQTIVVESSDGVALLIQTPRRYEGRLFDCLRRQVDTDADLQALYDAAMGGGEGQVAEYRDTIETIIQQRPIETWLKCFGDAGVPASPRQTYDEALQHEQIRARDASTLVEVPGYGVMPVAAPPFVFDGFRRMVTTAPLRLGFDTEAVLEEFGHRKTTASDDVDKAENID